MHRSPDGYQKTAKNRRLVVELMPRLANEKEGRLSNRLEQVTALMFSVQCEGRAQSVEQDRIGGREG